MMLTIIDPLCRQPKSTLLGIGLFLVLPIGLINYLVGVEVSFSILYLVPVFLVSWCAGRREGLMISMISAVAWFLADLKAGRAYSHPIIYYWNMSVMFGFFLVISLILSGLRRALEHEKKMARIDSLTGVPNARYFVEQAKKEIERSRRYQHPLTLVYIDCDFFKDVNDQFGHQTGDRLLGRVADTLQRNIRGSDIIGRLGGDEFGILMPEIGEMLAPQALDRLHDRLIESMKKGGWPVTFSMGVAIFLSAPDCVEDLIKRADNLMYSAKNRGKNQIQYDIFKNHVEVGQAREGSANFPG
jgi:diguanylate cyclase (GGDEF)-like protein